MPPQPAWFHRVKEILAHLRSLDANYIDRHAVEKLFNVRERRARQIMAGLPCLQVGNAVAVDRDALISRLENTAAGDRFQWEVSRRARIAQTLESIRKQAAAQRVQIPAASDVRDRVVRDLSSGIELSTGELRIRFTGPEDLAGKLFELSQAMANDWDGFVERIEERASSPRGSAAGMSS
jgi:hypothetical protein